MVLSTRRKSRPSRRRLTTLEQRPTHRRRNEQLGSLLHVPPSQLVQLDRLFLPELSERGVPDWHQGLSYGLEQSMLVLPDTAAQCLVAQWARSLPNSAGLTGPVGRDVVLGLGVAGEMDALGRHGGVAGVVAALDEVYVSASCRSSR